MDDGTGANQVDTFGRDEAGRQDVEVVGDIVVDDCVAGIWIERGIGQSVVSGDLART